MDSIAVYLSLSTLLFFRENFVTAIMFSHHITDNFQAVNLSFSGAL
jgi:hypothetical protein